MKRVGGNLKDIVFYLAALIILLVGMFLPKSGSLVLLDQFFDVLLIWIACAYVIFKVVQSEKEGALSKKVTKIIVVALGILLSIWFTKDVASDFIGGTQNVALHNVKTSKYHGYSGILSSHFYIIGIDENGNTHRLEISGDDYTRLSYNTSVTVTYYPHTNRVVTFR